MSAPRMSEIPAKGRQWMTSQARTAKYKSAALRSWLARGGYAGWQVSQALAPRHCEPSVLAAVPRSSNEGQTDLVDLLLRASELARTIDMSETIANCKSEQDVSYVMTWPGEHYRLLAALGQVRDVDLAVEVGTYTGLGTLALAQHAKRVVTYDIVPHTTFKDSVLSDALAQGNVEQRIGDLSDGGFFRSQLDTLRAADLIFVDGPKDGVFERVFGELLYEGLRDRECIVVWDDIRLMQMVVIWSQFPVVKLDASSLGHWSGTGFTTTKRV